MLGHSPHQDAAKSAVTESADAECIRRHANDGEAYLCSDEAWIAHLDAICADEFRKAGKVTDPAYCTDKGYRRDRMGPKGSLSDQFGQAATELRNIGHEMQAIKDATSASRAKPNRRRNRLSLATEMPLVEQENDIIQAAYAKGDYVTQLRIYQAQANRGIVRAQSMLAMMYEEGRRGVPQDYAEAAKWYRKLADQGYSSSQRKLAVMYREGRGVPQDLAEAAKWDAEAAKQDRKAADQADQTTLPDGRPFYCNSYPGLEECGGSGQYPPATTTTRRSTTITTYEYIPPPRHRYSPGCTRGVLDDPFRCPRY
jgi:hypothetical protein